jgi:uncharacterized membrane protein YeaQ/YmgE (transglycosylase-associated protein family)
MIEPLPFSHPVAIISAVAAVMPQPQGRELAMTSGAGAIGLLVAIIVIVLVGAIAGWLAGKIMAGRGFGFWANAGLGVIGAIVGSFVFAVLGIYAFGLIATIIKATVGAVIVLAIANWWRRRRAA